MYTHLLSREHEPELGGVGVSLGLDILALTEPAVQTGDFALEFFYNEHWTDVRLAEFISLRCPASTSKSYQSAELATTFWTPNVCVVNSRASRMSSSPAPNTFVFLHAANGSLWRNARLHMRCAAPLGHSRCCRGSWLAGPRASLTSRSTPSTSSSATSASKTTATTRTRSSSAGAVMTTPPRASPSDGGGVGDAAFLNEPVLNEYWVTSVETSAQRLFYPNGYWDSLTFRIFFKHSLLAPLTASGTERRGEWREGVVGATTCCSATCPRPSPSSWPGSASSWRTGRARPGFTFAYPLCSPSGLPRQHMLWQTQCVLEQGHNCSLQFGIFGSDYAARDSQLKSLDVWFAPAIPSVAWPQYKFLPMSRMFLCISFVTLAICELALVRSL